MIHSLPYYYLFCLIIYLAFTPHTYESWTKWWAQRMNWSHWTVSAVWNMAAASTGSRPTLKSFFPFLSATPNRLVSDQLHKSCLCSACFPSAHSLSPLLEDTVPSSSSICHKQDRDITPQTPTTNLPEILSLNNNVQEKNQEKGLGTETIPWSSQRLFQLLL